MPETLFATSSAILFGSGAFWIHRQHRKTKPVRDDFSPEEPPAIDLSVLPCINNRCSIFPSGFLPNPPPLDEAIIQSLLDAAICGPYHGKCYAGCRHPAKFVVLGKKGMVDMQKMTLSYYDKHWQESGWDSRDEYEAWRKMTEDEITGRWGPCQYMIAIVMRRQSGPKRFPEWEEAAAVAAAVQNMHLQSTKFPQLACYWSSWHDAARDSNDMREFLDMGDEDKCLGFFIVAQAKRRFTKKRNQKFKNRSMEIVWRP